MVERRKELDRAYHRKKKMRKLKTKLATVKDDREREKVVIKIKALSPFALTAPVPKK
jgi:AmiR/NasT family two-component response regulator